jgi:hypothetical protein
MRVSPSLRMSLLPLVFAVGCGASGESVRPASPAPLPPASSQEFNFGYDQAVALGAAFAQSRGFQMELAMAKVVEGGWLLSYAAGEGQPHMDLYVDSHTGQVELVPPPAPATAPVP